MRWKDYYDEDDIERIFNDEIRDKKRTGRGAFSKKGKGVKHNMAGVKFPFDYLSRKEKKALNGEMIVISGLGKLITFEEFNALDREQKKVTLEHWRKTHATKKIIAALDIDSNSYYKMLYDLEVIPAPPSYYKPANTSGVGKGNGRGRYDHLVAAEKGDITTFKSFDKLSDLEKFNLLEEYAGKYTTDSIGKIWGKSKNSIYNMKYHIKKNLEKEGLLPNPDKKDKTDIMTINDNANEQGNNNPIGVVVVSSNNKKTDEPPVQESTSAASPVVVQEQATVPATITVTEPLDTTSIEVVNAEGQLEHGHEQLSFETERTEQPVAEVNNENNANLANEIDELRQMILGQAKMFQDMMMNQQQIAATATFAPSPVVEQPVVAAAPIQPPQQAPVQPVQPMYGYEPARQSEMVFSFEDQREGFMLHQDIKRFISVLERNPDIFNVEIKITRKEQQ